MDILSAFNMVFDNLFASKQCSATSHTLLYTIIVMSVVISAAGVYVWRQYIRTQPKVEVK